MQRQPSGHSGSPKWASRLIAARDGDGKLGQIGAQLAAVWVYFEK
jgi:hypothetical protein